MDIKCNKCGEPWDIDSIHDRVDELADAWVATSFDEVRRDFYDRGCKALGSSCGPLLDAGLQNLHAELQDLLGDDIDGLASTLDDVEYLGLI